MLAVRDSATNLTYWRLTEVDSAGRFQKELLGNDAFTQRSYFADKQRLKSIVTESGAATVQNLAYDYPLNFVDPSGYQANPSEPTMHTWFEVGPDDQIRMRGVVIPPGQPPPPPVKKDEGEKVGAYVPPVDVSPTGNTATYDPQPATAAAEDWREDPAAQFRTGMLAGVALGLVPFAGVGEQILDAADVLPQTQSFRVGAAIGQIFGGLAAILGGVTGEVAGGLLTTTGIGAAVGVPAIAVSTTLILGGIGNIVAGVHGLMTARTGSSPPRATPSTKGGENGAAARGRAVHEEFAAKAKAKGWDSQPRLRDPATGRTVIPDAVTPRGHPVELKPNTPSGRAAGGDCEPHPSRLQSDHPVAQASLQARRRNGPCARGH